MASAKYYEVMSTDYEQEINNSLNSIFDTFNDFFDLVNKGELTAFDLDRNFSAVSWAEKTIKENLEDCKLIIERRKERQAKAEEGSAKKVKITEKA
jgi:hypothetical protein